MNNELTKLYNKAMNLYNKGKLNKALHICEEILASDLSYSEALNLKGLMLYQKGLLNEAKIVWKLNYDINNDGMAKKYIEDCKSDEERVHTYAKAEYSLKNMNIEQALLLFKECAQSDFNSIKVNTGIAMCYARKGDNYRAKEYVDKALAIDDEAVTANSIKKDLIKSGVYSSENNISKKILLIITIIFVIAAVCAGGYSIYSKIEKDNSEKQYTENNIEYDKQSEDNSDMQNNSQEEENLDDNNTKDSISEDYTEGDNNKTAFSSDEVSKLVNNKEVDRLYDYINEVDNSSLSASDLDLYNKAVEILKTDGVSKFYEYGVWNFNNKNYDSAKIELEKAYKYCNESYLKEHIVFYKGSTASQIGDNSEALKLYKEYYSLYPKGAYIEGVLYELALLTNTTNKDMGKEYAEELVKNYPNSLYINDYIRGIVN